MKKILLPSLFLLLICLYAIQAVVISVLPKLDGNGELAILSPAIIIAVIAIVLCLINIGFAIYCANSKKIATDKRKQRTINRTVLIFKLLAIPFFILNYAFWFMMNVALWVVPGLFVLSIIFAFPVGVGFTYLVLLSSSSYSIAILKVLYKNGEITKKKFILHTILQLLFMVDVIDQIIIQKFTKIKTKPRRT